MKYVILIMNTPEQKGMSDADQAAWMTEVMAWYEKWGV
jgi:hypothetical protein